MEIDEGIDFAGFGLSFDEEDSPKSKSKKSKLNKKSVKQKQRFEALILGRDANTDNNKVVQNSQKTDNKPFVLKEDFFFDGLKTEASTHFGEFNS